MAKATVFYIINPFTIRWVCETTGANSADMLGLMRECKELNIPCFIKMTPEGIR